MYKSVVYINICILFIIVLLSCAKTNGPDKVEIPFVIENNRIVICATINGKTGKFTFDTGATESYLNISTKNLLPTAYTTTQYNGKPKKVLIYRLNKITFGNTEIKTRSWVINRSDVVINKQKEGYDGVLGNRIFEGYWCELSFSKSKIILQKDKPEYFSKYSPVKIESKYDADFYIPATIDNELFYFNIDTGLFDAIYFPDGIIKMKPDDEYQEIYSLEEVNIYYLTKVKTIELLDVIYKDKIIMTNSFIAKRRGNKEYYRNRGLLGLDFLKYYDFLFDYRELRKGKTTGMYYEQNTPLEDRKYGFYSFLNEVPQFGVLDFSISETDIKIISVIKDSPAYTLFGIRPGTTITKINNKPINEFSREELFEPLFYFNIMSYTAYENGKEMLFIPLLKENK
jgi:hypothetical protein